MSARAPVSTCLGELELKFLEQLCVSLVHAFLRHANPCIATKSQRAGGAAAGAAEEAGSAAETRQKIYP